MNVKQLTAITTCFFLLSLLSSWIPAPQGAAIPGIFRTAGEMEADYTTCYTGGLKYGKYGCTASKYRGGAYEYIPRGYFTISKEGKYTYYGFKKPSSGTFTVDAKGNLLFKGGYFNGGKAEKIDRPNKFFLVFPANPDHRWTCSLVDSQ